jgi:hypothetical protein
VELIGDIKIVIIVSNDGEFSSNFGGSSYGSSLDGWSCTTLDIRAPIRMGNIEFAHGKHTAVNHWLDLLTPSDMGLSGYGEGIGIAPVAGRLSHVIAGGSAFANLCWSKDGSGAARPSSLIAVQRLLSRGRGLSICAVDHLKIENRHRAGGHSVRIPDERLLGERSRCGG